MKTFAVTAVLSASLLAGCAESPAASEPTVTVTATTTVTAAVTPVKTATPRATPTAMPTPVPMKTSGNYGADLAAASVIPDSVDRYATFMEGELCGAPLTKHKLWDRSEFSERIRQLSSPASDNVASIRLSVAYFCPQRVALAEEALKLHGYLQ